MPSQVFAEPAWLRVSDYSADDVRAEDEGVTAEYAEDPQSHRPHASTTRRLMRDPTASGGSMLSSALNAVTVRHRIPIYGSAHRPRRTEHVLQRVHTVSENTVNTCIDEPFHDFGVVDCPDLHLFAGSMSCLNQCRGQDGELATDDRDGEGNLAALAQAYSGPCHPRQEPVRATPNALAADGTRQPSRRRSSYSRRIPNEAARPGRRLHARQSSLPGGPLLGGLHIDVESCVGKLRQQFSEPRNGSSP